jgi:Sulfatase
VPVKLPVAASKIPVPPMIVPVSVPLIGKPSPRLPQTPGEAKLLNVSSMKMDPPARLIVRRSHVPPQPAPNSIPERQMAEADRPNILFFHGDNLGFGDLSCYSGGPSRGATTERIDAFAGDGFRLTNYCPESQCTPTRSALLTGRHAIRSGTYMDPWATKCLMRKVQK